MKPIYQIRLLLLINIQIFFNKARGECSLNCELCDAITSLCKQCSSGYFLDTSSKQCNKIQCQYGQFLDPTSSQCVSICPQHYIKDEQNGICSKINECPNKIEYGQEYFDIVQQVLITTKFVLLRGKNELQQAPPLVLLDNNDYRTIGNMNDHQDYIINMLYIAPTLDDISASNTIEYLYSYSATEIAKWNLETTENIYLAKLPNDIIISNNFNSINQDYLIVLKNDNLSQQFGIVDLKALDSKKNQKDLKVDFKLFPKFHTKAVQSICIMKNYIYSFAGDNHIVQWDIAKADFSKEIFSFPQEILNMYCNEEKNIIVVVIENTSSIYVCFASKQSCKVSQTTHNSINKVIFTKDVKFGFFLFFTLSDSEMNLFTFDDDTVDFLQYAASDISYFYEYKGFIYIISSQGKLSMFTYEIQETRDSAEIYSISQEFTKNSLQSSSINHIAVNQNSDLLIANTNLSILKITKQKNPQQPNQQYLVENNGTKRKLSEYQRGHSDRVNGIIFDNLYDRVITYSNDGSFRIWDEINLSLGEFRLVLFQFHPDCPQFLQSDCNKQLQKMDFLTSNILITQYNDNKLILWDYQTFGVKIRDQLERKVDLQIINFYFLNTKFLIYCNQKMWQVYNLQDKTYTYKDKNVRYAVLETINSITQVIYYDATLQSLVVCPYPDCSTITYQTPISGSILFIQYYAAFKLMAIGTGNSFLYMLPSTSNFNRPPIAIFNPVYISMHPSTAKNIYVFSQNFNLNYYSNSGTTYTLIQTPLVFSSIFPQQAVSFTNTEMHFFFQNTINSQIQNQVFGFGPSYNVRLMLTFTDKISTINVDKDNNKIYIGFQNGQIKTGYFQYVETIFSDNFLYQEMMYSPIYKQIIAYSQGVTMLDIVDWKKSTIPSVHTKAPNGGWFDEKTRQLVTYSNETASNIVKWNLNDKTSFIFKNGHNNFVYKVYVDLTQDKMISFSQDFTFIVWQYSTGIVLNTLDFHLQDYNFFINSGSEEIFSVIQYQHDIKNTRVFSLNSMGKFYSLNYLNYEINLLSNESLINFWIDMNYYDNRKIFLIVKQDSSSSYIKFIDDVTFKELYNLEQNHRLIQEIRFINDKVYTVDPQLIVVMNRITLQEISRVISQNPLISNFIVFEKMDHIYIYSDWSLDVFNYRIGVYSLSTGNKITDIVNAQEIENGNISMVVLDEEAYQLIVFKSLKVYTFTIDVRTFRYTQYITIAYSWYVKQGIVLKENNKFIFRDSSRLRVYNIDPGVNQLNNLRDITEPKILDYYYNQNTKTIYYIDSDSTIWSQCKVTKSGFQEIDEIDTVKFTFKIADFFYVITNQFVIKYDINLKQVNKLTLSVKTYQYTQTHFLIVDYDKNFKCLNIDSFNQVGQSQLVPSFPLQMITQESYQEVFLVLADRVLRFSYSSCTLIETAVVANMKFIRIDPIRNLIYHVLKTGAITVYQGYSKSNNYFANPKSLGTLTGAQELLMDNTIDRIFILRVGITIPIVNVYTFIKDTLVYTQQPSIIVPSNLLTTKIKIQQGPNSMNFVVYTPYYFALYYLNTNSVDLVAILKDNEIFQSIISVQNIGIPNLFLLNSIDSLQVVEANFQTNYKKVHLKLNLLSYQIIESSITKNGEYINLDLFGISSGKSFNHKFSINLSQNSASTQPQLQNQQCYFSVPQHSYQIELGNLIQNVQESSSTFKFPIKKSLINVDAVSSFYYDELFNQLGSNVVYQNSNSVKRIVTLSHDTFSKNDIDQLQIQNYQFDLSKVQGKIQFSSKTKVIILKDIDFMQTANEIQFQFISLKQVILENITIQNLNVISSQLFYFEDVESIMLKNVKIQNLKLSNYSQLFVFKQITSLLIEQLNIYQLEVKSVNLIKNNLKGSIGISYSNILIEIENSQYVKINICRIESISSQEYYNSIFQLRGIQTTIIQQANYQQSSEFQFINWSPLYESGSKSIFIDHSQFSLQDSIINGISNLDNLSLIYLEGYQVKVSNVRFDTIHCITCNGAAINFNNVQTIHIIQSSFFHNIAQNGGATAIQNCGVSQNSQQACNDNDSINPCRLLLEFSIFEQNEALESGGALYLQNSNLEMKESQIRLNKAIIGGGVRYLELQPIFAYNLLKFQNSKDNQYDDHNVIQMNKAIVHSNNVGSNLYKIVVFDEKLIKINDKEVKITNNTAKVISEVNINSFKSGGYLQFKFQIIDEEQNPLYFDPLLYKKEGYPSSIMEEMDSFYIKSTISNNKIKLFGQQQSDYNYYDQITKVFSISGLMVIADPQTENFLLLQSPSIQRPTTDSKENRKIDEGPFYLKLIINFRDCVPGEVFRKSGILYYCQECTEGTYSLLKPTQENFSVQSCLKCPESASYCYGNQMTLKDGYWKVSNSSNSLVYCTNMPSNCNGDSDKSYCIEGHVGPLCEACDIKGDIWGKQYASDGNFNCLSCDQVQHAKYILPTIFLILGMIVYIVFSLKIALQISKLIVIGYYLRMMNVCPINKSSFQDTTNMNIKSLMNYLQISQIVNTVKVELPSFITFLPQYLGSPIQNMMYTLDCWFTQSVQGSIPIVFQRTLWSLFIPLIYLSGVLIVYMVTVLLRYARFQISYVQSGFVFLFLYLQPNMISNLLSVMSCRKIDERMYIQSDVSFECYTFTHVKYVCLICLPGILLWAFIIPIYILRQLIKNKKQLDCSKVRMRFGFLYQDYKNKNYYWEFVRSYLKVLIVCIYNFYGDPYSIHNTYQAFLIWEVIKAKIQISFKKEYSYVKKKIIEWFPALEKYITIQKDLSFNTFKYWKIVRFHILKLKEQKLSGQVRDQIFGISSASQQKDSRSNHNQQEQPNINSFNHCYLNRQNKSISHFLSSPRLLNVTCQEQIGLTANPKINSSHSQFFELHCQSNNQDFQKDESHLAIDNNRDLSQNILKVESQQAFESKENIIFKNLRRIILQEGDEESGQLQIILSTENDRIPIQNNQNQVKNMLNQHQIVQSNSQSLESHSDSLKPEKEDENYIDLNLDFGDKKGIPNYQNINNMKSILSSEKLNYFKSQSDSTQSSYNLSLKPQVQEEDDKNQFQDNKLSNGPSYQDVSNIETNCSRNQYEYSLSSFYNLSKQKGQETTIGMEQQDQSQKTQAQIEKISESAEFAYIQIDSLQKEMTDQDKTNISPLFKTNGNREDVQEISQEIAQSNDKNDGRRIINNTLSNNSLFTKSKKYGDILSHDDSYFMTSPKENWVQKNYIELKQSQKLNNSQINKIIDDFLQESNKLSLKNMYNQTEIQEHQTVGTEFILQSPKNTFKYLSQISQLKLNLESSIQQSIIPFQVSNQTPINGINTPISMEIQQQINYNLQISDAKQQQQPQYLDEENQTENNSISFQQSNLFSKFSQKDQDEKQTPQSKDKMYTFQQLDGVVLQQNSPEKAESKNENEEVISIDKEENLLNENELQFLQPYSHSSFKTNKEEYNIDKQYNNN